MKHVRMAAVISGLGLASLLLISTALLLADTQNEGPPDWAVGIWDLDVMTPEQGGTQSIVLHVKPGGAIKYDGASKGVVFTRSNGGLGFVSGSGYLRYASFNEPYDVVSIVTGALRPDGTGSGTCGVCDSRTSEVSTFTWTAQRRGDPTKVLGPQALIEQAGPLIQIEAWFVEVEKTEGKAFGIDWFVANGSAEFFNLGFAPGTGINVARFRQGRFESELRALLTEGRVELVNAPRVSTGNNMPAMVSFTREIPYFSAVTTYDEHGQRSVDLETETMAMTESLTVTPRILGDNTIVLDIEAEIDDQVGTLIGPDGATWPVVNAQSFYTKVRVGDGETIVIGGLSHTSESRRLLMTAPVEGTLISESLRKRLAAEQNKQLLIFVTPRILREIPPQ